MSQEKHIVVWDECLGIIRNNLDAQQYDTWFKPIKSISLIGSELTVEVPSHFFCDHIETHFLDLLQKTLQRVIGPTAQLVYNVTAVKGEAALKVPIAPAKTPENEQVPLVFQYSECTNAMILPGLRPVKVNPHLNSNYSFKNLVVGECNRIAVSAGLTIAENPGQGMYNPIFIFGGSGLGKTHIAQAIGIAIKEKFPEKQVLYVQGNTFKNQLVDAIVNHNKLASFVAFYQRMDVLIMDDIQELSSTGTQNAFFNIMNQIHLSDNKQLILTSDRPQSELRNFENRVLSRLRWGMSVELMMPDYQTRLEMLKMHCANEGMQISDEVLTYIATNVRSNFRELEGVLKSVMAHAVIAKSEPSLELVTRITSQIVGEKSNELTINDVIASVCDYFNITTEDMMSNCRKRNIVQARQIAMYLSRNLTSNSLATIGSEIGNKNHATVLHACTTVTDLMSTDRLFKQYVNDIEKALTEVGTTNS